MSDNKYFDQISPEDKKHNLFIGGVITVVLVIALAIWGASYVKSSPVYNDGARPTAGQQLTEQAGKAKDAIADKVEEATD